MVPELQRLEDADRAAGRAGDQRVRVGLYFYAEPVALPRPATPSAKSGDAETS
jgi:hypothetical protein